ncbi:hypothetical protein P3S67_019335 [Capsicum chacoense]
MWRKDFAKPLTTAAMASSPSIPEDIIFELFSWLPVKSLMRFRCVSKYCNSLVVQPDFVNIHQCRSMTRPGGTKLLMREDDGFYTSVQNGTTASLSRIDGLHELPDFFGLHYSLQCVNGIFCFWRGIRFQPAVICNPSTRQVKFLPKLDMGSSEYHYSLGFEPEEKIFKVIFMEQHVVIEAFTRMWVFTLGLDESWRESENIHHLCPKKDGVCIDGVIYMLNRYRWNTINIVAFDVKTESLITTTTTTIT